MSRKQHASGSRPARSLQIRDDGELLLLISVLEGALAGGDIVSRSRSTVDRWLAQLRSMAPPAPAKQNVFDLDGLPHVAASEAESVRQIFEYWRARMKKPRAHLDSRRRTRIVQRLRDGYTPAEIMTAIRGCASDAWSRGDNDRGIAFDDVELICRDSVRLERFIELAHSPRQPRPSTASRNSAGLKAARDAWAKVISHVRGPYRSGGGVDDGGPVDRAVRAMGGFHCIGQSNERDLPMRSNAGSSIISSTAPAPSWSASREVDIATKSRTQLGHDMPKVRPRGSRFRRPWRGVLRSLRLLRPPHGGFDRRPVDLRRLRASGHRCGRVLMTQTTIVADPLRCSRAAATSAQLEQACRLLADDEHNDHTVAAALQLDVQFVRHAIAQRTATQTGDRENSPPSAEWS